MSQGILTIGLVFLELTAAAREVRGPLVIGASALATTWIASPEWCRRQAEHAGRELHLSALDDWTGPAARFSFLVLAAYVVGSAIYLLGAETMVNLLISCVAKPRWDELLGKARSRVRDYEAGESAAALVPLRQGSQRQISEYWAAHLAAEVELRERRRSESETRAILLVASVPIAVAGSIRWSCWFVVVPFLLLGVLWVGNWRSADHLLAREVALAENQLEEKKRRGNALEAEAEAFANEVRELEATRAELRRRHRRFHDRVLRRLLYRPFTDE